MFHIKSSSLLLFYFSLLTIVLPNLYLFLASQIGSFDYFMFRLIDPKYYFEGLMFSMLSMVLFWIIASSNQRHLDRNAITLSAARSHQKWGQILLFFAYIALIVDLLISVLYGMPETNLSSSRPYIVVFIGYIIGPLKLSVYIYFLLALLCNNAKKEHIIFLLLLLLGGGLAVGSRSAMFTVLSLFVLSFPLVHSHFKVSFTRVFSVLLFVILTGFLGNLIRSGGSDDLLFLLVMRFFQNSAVLYFALSDFEAVNQILLADQPGAMLSQMFSFTDGRSILPSSVRLPEFWGQDVIESDGHLVGYVYGWLGLSYGLFQWAGVLITCAMAFLLRYCGKMLENAGIGTFAIVSYSILMVNEYFFNLGLDSFIEKGFKRGIFFLVLFFTLQLVASLVRGLRDKEA